MGIYTVSGLNDYIKGVLTNDPHINQIWVRGEISNLTKHTSGHYYFTIKDRTSQISCVSFRSTNRIIKFEPETSMNVLIFGSIDVYAPRGQYQLRVLDMRPDGVGELYKAFEQMKKRLDLEGLFERTHKKEIPKYPRRVGVVTSPTGAAIHDILEVAKRRCPVDILLAPSLVQGERAAQSIASSIDMLNRTDVDVIIVGRGGGSLEDLWPFNEEIVARAIFSSGIPVVSAVGHETDYTIADFTADKRAPTPSAAAELVVPNRQEIKRHVESLTHRMEQAVLNNTSQGRTRFERLQSRIDPERLADSIRQNQQRIDEMTSRMQKDIMNILLAKEASLKILAGKLDGVSPLKTIERGYSITTRQEDKRIIQSIHDTNPGDMIEIIVKDGTIRSMVKDTRKKQET